MKSVDGLVLTFLGNALWQIPVLLAAGILGARLLRRGPTRFRHALWLGVLAASVLLPAASLLPRQPSHSAHRPRPLTALAAGDQTPDWPAWVSRRADRARIPGGLAGFVVVIYGLSLAAHAVRLARAWRWTGRLARGAREVADLPGPAASVAARCREAFGLGSVPILTSSAVDGPVTLGARRPAILLPPTFLENAPAEHLTAALGHEMAHIRRHDFLINVIGELWLLPVAFHPALRWLRRHLAAAREMACDEAAVERLLAPGTYARSLLSIATTLAGSSRPAYTLGALDADLLEVRMRRLLDSGPRLGARRARATLSLAALLLAAAGLTAAAFSFAAPAAGATAGELSAFVGTWRGDYSPEPGLTLPANELVIQDAGGGAPRLTVTWFRHKLQEDLSVQTDRMSPRVLDVRVTGRTLRFRTQSEMKYSPDSPQEMVERDEIFELIGEGQGRLRQVWSSLEGRQDVPPPAPPTILKRQS
jgi:beta-lactamase regulating signal transducer with metallopeptidase domain